MPLTALRTRTLMVAAALVATGAAIACAGAQSRDTVNRIAPNQPLLRRGDVVFLGSAFAAVAVTTLADRHFRSELQAQGRMRSGLHGLTSLGTTVGDAGPLAFTLTLWAGGAVAHQRQWERLGRQGAEAFLLAGSTTILVKGLVGRERPSASVDDADIYKVGRGFGNNAFQSFPSGHTSVAFAVATVMAVGTAHNSPLVHRTVSVLAFGVATSVGLSRMYDNQHWTSDVLGGAAVGITSGLIAMRYDSRRRDTPNTLSLSSLLDHVSIAPTPQRGLAVGFSTR